jgi:hypothetical protein
MIGETENPVVIGKASKPCCFKKNDLKELPIVCKSNKKSMDDISYRCEIDDTI